MPSYFFSFSQQEAQTLLLQQKRTSQQRKNKSQPHTASYFTENCVRLFPT